MEGTSSADDSEFQDSHSKRSLPRRGRLSHVKQRLKFHGLEEIEPASR